MHFPFLVADPHSRLHYRPTDTRLAELSLAPRAVEWAPGRAIVAAPDAVWDESLSSPLVEMGTLSGVLSSSMLTTGKSNRRGNDPPDRFLPLLIHGAPS